MKITTHISGDDEFRKKLDRLIPKLREPAVLYKSWGMEVLKWIQMNYRMGGGKLITGKWRRLSRITIMGRRKGSDKPLLDTGHMMRQWNYRILGSGVEVGNPMDIARYHEEGTRPYVIRPVRRKCLWFGVPPADRRRGQQLGGYQRWRIKSQPYKPWAKGAPGIFSKEIHHPGLTARRQLPNEREIMPTILKVTDLWLDKITRE